jgi:hypothetical protein
MQISIGSKMKVKPGTGFTSVPLHPADTLVMHKDSRLIDVRAPQAFRQGFIPGSYNVPDLACAAAVRRNGMFARCPLYLLANNIGQVEIYAKRGVLSPAGPCGESAVVGWFGSEAIKERQKSSSIMGFFEAVNDETVLLRMAASNTLVLDISDQFEKRAPSHSSALRFGIDDLPSSLEGLPVETGLCVTASTAALASFAASLLWNFGFHKVTLRNGS